MDSTLHYTSVSHTGSLMATINKMRVNSDLCDVTVVVGEYRIMAHKIILSASAPFFYQMLQLHSPPHPTNTSSNNEVQLNNIDEIAALKIIEFCYTSAISLDDDTVWPLLAASIKFQLPEICSFCCEFLVSGLDTSNCVLSLRLAAKVHCPQLEENCVRFLLENIDKVCASRGLTSLSTPELYSLLSVLALHDVGPATMAKLVGVWMEEDPATRQHGVFTQLLQVFPNMSPYLHQFGQHAMANGKKERDSNLKETVDSNNKVDGKLQPLMEEGRLTISDARKANSHPNYHDRLGKARLLNQDYEEAVESSSSPKGRSLFGVGASREFICISCGDDFDCEEDLVLHQNKCDESARMVGSASCDSLREGLGRKRTDYSVGNIVGSNKVDENKMVGVEDLNDEGKNESSENVMGVSNLRKRKSNNGNDDEMANNSNEKIDKSLRGEKKIQDKSVEDPGKEADGIGLGQVAMENDEEKLSGKDKHLQENLSSSEVRSNKTPDSGETEIYEPERDEDAVCTNDDNNNAISRFGEGFAKDNKFIDTALEHSSNSKVSNVSNNIENQSKMEKDSSFPDLLSFTSSLHLTESYFKTRKLSDIHQESHPGRHRYSSSLAGLESASSSSNFTNKASSNSLSSSLQHLRPQHRCLLCGRSFWERKHLSQHWVLDHGVRTRAVLEDGEQVEQDSSSHLPKSKQSSMLSQMSKDIQAESFSLTSSNPWPFVSNYLGQGSVVDSLFKSGSSSAFRSTNQNGWGDSLCLSQQDSNLMKIQGKLDNNNKRMAGDSSMYDKREVVAANVNQQPNLDEKVKREQDISPYKPNLQDSRLATSFTKQENIVKKEVNDDSNVKLLTSAAAAGSFALPDSHGLTQNDFLTSYLNHYNKLAQWCLSQGPNFCPACLVYHTNGASCPKSQNSLERQSSHTAINTGVDAGDKKEMVIKREETRMMEQQEEEDKEVNVDGEEEMEEGPLDMSKSTLEFSINSANNLSSSSSSSTQFVSPVSGHQPHHLHNQRPSPNSLLIPPYYGYSHFLSGNSILDMTTAAANAAVTNAMKAGHSASDNLMIMTSQSPLSKDNNMLTAAATASHLFRDERGDQHNKQSNYASYHHHPFSGSSNTNSSNNTNNINNKGNSAAAAFQSIASRSQNSLSHPGSIVNNNNSSLDISASSSSPSSSIFSFPSSPANVPSLPPSSVAAASSSHSHHLPPTTSGGGRKKSSQPPKQGFSCTVCNRVYSHQTALFNHMRSHSPSTRSYRCQFCNENFARAPDLKVHVCPNGVEKPFNCPSCGQTFAKNIHLKRHLATHSGLKPYPCWVCGKRFSRSDHLKRHTQSIHAGARPHACHICGKEFVRKYELNKHMSSHNNNN